VKKERGVKSRMPKIRRLMIRSAYAFLFLGICLGAAMLIHKAYPLHYTLWLLLPNHIEMLIFCWIIQVTLGTAYSILPGFLKAHQRGPTVPAYLMVVSLNSGILLTITGHIIGTGVPVQLVGRSLELVAVILFISLHWGRIITYRS